MSSHKTPPRKTLEFAATLCLVPPILIQVMWMNASRETSNINMQKADFLSYFPSYLQTIFGINLFSLAFCIAAIVLGCISFNQKKLLLRLLCLGTVLVASILGLASIYRMML